MPLRFGVPFSHLGYSHTNPNPSPILARLFVALMVFGAALLVYGPQLFVVTAQRGTKLARPVPQGGAAKGGEPNFGGLPLSFEPNRGQADSYYRFLTHGGGYTLFLADREAVLEIPLDSAIRDTKLPIAKRRRMASAHAATPGAGWAKGLKDNPARATESVRLQLLGAKATPPTGADPLPGRVNYYIGNDPKKWHENIETYAQVEYHDVYPGVDLVYHGWQGQLEYDFVVAPGADPGAIALAVGAVREPPGEHHRAPLQVAGNGDLLIPSAAGDVRFRKPVVYQEEQSTVDSSQLKVQDETNNSNLVNPKSSIENRKFISGHYLLDTQYHVHFALGPYDHSKELVIDPAIVYSVFVAEVGASPAKGIGVDGAGNTYITGASTTTTIASSFTQIYVTGVNAQASAYLYTTFLGGSDGANPVAIAVDSPGNAYITGSGGGTFPTTPGAYDSTLPTAANSPTNPAAAIVAKLSPTGSLVYSTFIGSPSASTSAITVDSSGDAYITGEVGDDLPLVNPFQSTYSCEIGWPCSSAFVQEFNPAGSQLIYSTYLGAGSGHNATGGSSGTGIAVDSAGSAYVVGLTGLSNFPTLNALEPFMAGKWGAPFLAKFTPDGTALEYSTYLGGSGSGFYQPDTAVAVAVDLAGNAYVTGVANSPDFPYTPNAYRVSCFEAATDPCNFAGIYVLKVAPNGQSLVYSTYLGEGIPYAIAADSAGYAWVVGTTISSFYPTVQAIDTGPQQTLLPIGSNWNAAVSRFDPNGNLVFSSYLGGLIYGGGGGGVAVDSTGNAYVTGSSGVDNPVLSDFPVTSSLPVPSGGQTDSYVAKLTPAPVGPVVNLSPLFTPVLVLRNMGDQTLTINSMTTSSSISLQGDSCGTSLAPGAACVLVIYLSNPNYPLNGTLTINSNAAGSPQTFPIAIQTGTGGPVLISSNGLGFPARLVGTASPSQSFTITNLDYPNSVTFTNLALGTPAPGLAISTDFSETSNCPVTLAPGASCTVNVTYSPTAGSDGLEGNAVNIDTAFQSASVGVQGYRSNESTFSSASGYLVQALVPQTVQFGTVLVGTSPPPLPRVISLTSVSAQSVTLSGFTVTAPFAQTNNCGGSLAAGASCRVTITFNPPGNGNFTGTLTVANSGQGGPTVINLAGAGMVPSQLGISPLSLQFPAVNDTGNLSLPLTLTNLGTTTISLTSFNVTSSFSQTNNCGGSLAPAATCTVTVTFDPTTLGAITGTLTIPFTGGAGSPQVIPLIGTGAPQLAVYPTQLTFAQQLVGTTSAPQDVSMTNSGTSALTISNASLTGNFQFVSNDCGGSLQPSAQCNMEVTFDPTTAGDLAGAITVTASDLMGTHIINLSGTGYVAPSVSLSANSLSFPALMVSSTSAAQTLTVTNTGNGALDIASVTPSGPFAETNTCSTAAVAVNGTCMISVTFTPTASGAATGALVLVDNAADSPQSVVLSGTGEDFSISAASGGTTSASVAPGQTATYNLSLTPLSGLAGAVALTCAGAPSEAACSVNPMSASLNGANSTTVTVTVTTTASSVVGPRLQPPAGPWRGLWLVGLLTALGAWLMLRRRYRWQLAWVPFTVGMLAVILCVVCGGGGGGGGSPPNPGTPAGTYNLTVTGSITSGSSTVQHNITLTLNVS
jgi:hypothetical protein